MKWLAKLQQNNIEESKLGKKITAKINEYKQVNNEIKELEADRSQISSEDLEEFDNDLQELKDELGVMENNICSEIDKYIENTATSNVSFVDLPASMDLTSEITINPNTINNQIHK